MVTFLFMLFICLLIPMILFFMSRFIYFKNKLNLQKLSPFECGFDNSNSARVPFSTRFFLLGIIFIIFDIEIVLLMPIPLLSLVDDCIYIFLFIMMLLFIGLIHEWMEGSLDWMN
uniref:NADH-ubiquinone oxidoreductase chain 3 n=1 Tax=Hirudinaria manillensis TaxID=1348078 RepID=X2C8Q3_HIRMN|nr:NADH dehydrogenase subunit 3 [Hirudinaria manillensis]AGL34586.1 NADH dehydrogenase subunit 3 [Hirudinaria manillensis]